MIFRSHQIKFLTLVFFIYQPTLYLALLCVYSFLDCREQLALFERIDVIFYAPSMEHDLINLAPIDRKIDTDADSRGKR